MFNVIIFLVFCLLFGCEGESKKAQNKAQNIVESDLPEIRGYDSAVFGTEGAKVTVTGFIDPKFKCRDVTESQREICTTALVGSSNEEKFMPIKLRVCNEHLKRNCIFENIEENNNAYRHWAIVYDDNSNPIDFEGCRIIDEERNGWYCDGQQLNFTGVVAVKDGRGYFARPIDRITAISR